VTKAAQGVKRGAALGTLVLGVGLASCSGPAGTPLPKGDPLACAVGGAKAFAQECTVERQREGDTLFLTVRHPDGGFRRFEVLKDGKGLAPADGMKPATVAFANDVLTVTVDADRYRFPATAMKHADTP